jgi:hypothetical protein
MMYEFLLLNNLTETNSFYTKIKKKKISFCCSQNNLQKMVFDFFYFIFDKMMYRFLCLYDLPETNPFYTKKETNPFFVVHKVICKFRQ